MRKHKLAATAIIICSLFLFHRPVEAKFINTFNFRINGAGLSAGDEVRLAKHDIIFLNKYHYDDINGDTWGAIKNINPNAEIYLYQDLIFVQRLDDNKSTVMLGNIGRYDVSRGHSMGSLNGGNPSFFQLNKSGTRTQLSTINQYYLLDFGNSRYQDYAIEAAIADNVNRPWTADGVYSDHFFPLKGSAFGDPVKYDTDAKWSAAMNSMANKTKAGLISSGQKFACNRGFSFNVDGSNAWLALDQMATPPDVVTEESTFATGYGAGDINYLSEPTWKLQVDLLGKIRNSKVCFQSQSELDNTSEIGTDNWGKSFTFWDALYYSMSSYLLGKNDSRNNAYFAFTRTSNYRKVDIYYDEYDKIDLGKALSSYKISNINGNNIYWREFEYGYVYVNPTLNDVTSISLPELCKQRSHNNLSTALNNLPNINSISLKSHRAAILYKSNPPSSSSNPPPPSPPATDNSSILLEAEDGVLYSPMRSVTDSNASSGEYIWVSSGNGGYAVYSFNIPEAGTYYIWGRVKGTTVGYNSFYFSVDNGNHVTWNLPVSSNWGWDQAASAYFSAGQHTIKIEQREYRAQLDQLLITKDQNYVPQGSINQTTIEAEDGVLHSPMRSVTDSNASSGAYIYSSTNYSGYAEYSFNVPKSGTYFIWGRALSPHSAADSFYISVDNGSEIEWHIPIFTNWNWDQAAVASLNAGQHTLNIRQRERNTKLDKILITNDPDNVPNE